MIAFLRGDRSSFRRIPAVRLGDEDGARKYKDRSRRT